jgi:hypothetical protein
VEAGVVAVKPWVSLAALFIGQGGEVRGRGRQDGGGRWAASMDSSTGSDETRVPLLGRGGGSGLGN